MMQKTDIEKVIVPHNTLCPIYVFPDYMDLKFIQRVEDRCYDLMSVIGDRLKWMLNNSLKN